MELNVEEEMNKFLNSINNFGNIQNKHIFDTKIEFNEELVQHWLNNRKYIAELLYRKKKMVQLQMIFTIDVIIRE